MDILRRGLLAGVPALLLPSLARAEPRNGGVLRFVVNPEPSTLVCVDNSFGAAQKIGPKVNEGLLSYDFTLRPQPQLATAWSISGDGLRYTFTLRPNVFWHDGKPFTADDVKFSILTLKRTHPRGRGTFSGVTDVKTSDALTAVIELSRPAPYLITALAACESPIVPRHIYEGTDVTANPNGEHPIGTGPFLFREWVKGSHVILDRNPNYWDKPKPYLDRVIIRFIPDGGARAASFEAKELDLGGDTPVPMGDLERVKAIPYIGLETRGYQYTGNQSQLIFNLDTKPLQDLRVRQAIAHAVDLKALLATAWYGYGRVSPTPISPLLTQFDDPSIKPYAYDPALSGRLLDEAGFPRDQSGKRLPLRLTFNPYNDGNRRSAEFIRQALAHVGVDATLAAYDFAAFVKTVYTDRAFDIESEQLSNTFDPTLGVQRVYWSKNFKPGLGFSNGAHYTSETADRLLEAAAVEPDPAARRELFFKFQRVVYDDLPVLNLIAFDTVTVFNRRVQNHTLTADGVNANFADVWLDGVA
jgi:peptide/nickel transport system substrate-binding protein